MDKGKPNHKVALGILRERSQNPPLGCNQLLLITGMGESGTQKPADYHGSIESY